MHAVTEWLLAERADAEKLSPPVALRSTGLGEKGEDLTE